MAEANNCETKKKTGEFVCGNGRLLVHIQLQN